MKLSLLCLPLLMSCQLSGAPAQAIAPLAGLAKVNGTELYYETMGEGDSLILISGGGNMDRRMWDEQFVRFAQNYKVVRYDVRGVGKSRIPTEPYSPSEDLYFLMKFLGVNRALILGLSFGGRVAIDFALDHPDMVEALVLAAPGVTGYSDDRQLVQSLQALTDIAREQGLNTALEIALDNPFVPLEEPVREKMKQILSENAHLFYLGFPNIALMRSVDPPALDRLGEIRARTLIMVGDRDHPQMLSIADLLQEKITGSRKVVISGASHFVNLEKKEEFNRIVLDFLGIQK